MTLPWISRRTFLADLGHGALALAVVNLAACAPSSVEPSPSGPSGSPAGSAAPGSAAPAGSGDGAAIGVDWTRVDLGFVSAYILVRDEEAAIVDTGVVGSETAIGEALTGVGLGWDEVGHVIFTHLHGDHAGSSDAVLTLAAGATGYAGAPDLPAIAAPRPLTPVADGDTVFGLRIVGTPGHTAGHVAVLDEVGGLLVAGDALRTTDGTLAGPDPGFSDDMTAATASVAKLGTLRFETLLVGHGDPIETGASAAVAALAAAS